MMANLNFQQALLQSSVSHDHHSNMLVLKKYVFLLSMLKTTVFEKQYFCENEHSLKEQHLFCSKFFTVTFALFNAPTTVYIINWYNNKSYLHLLIKSVLYLEIQIY